MALSDALSKWPPYGFIDSEIGRIAVFGLSLKADQDLKASTKHVDDPIKFARCLARQACFPCNNLRDGKYRPRETFFSDKEISRLSESSLVMIALFFVKDDPEQPTVSAEGGQVLSVLMTQFRDDWKKRSKMYQDLRSPFRELGDGYLSIGTQIKALNTGIAAGLGSAFSQQPSGSSPEGDEAEVNFDNTISGIVNLQSSKSRMLADAATDLEEIREGIKVTASALRQVAAIQEAMNTQASQQVEAEQLQRVITRKQNRLVVMLTVITLFATVSIGPVSRLSCAVSRATKMLALIPALELAAKIACGY